MIELGPDAPLSELLRNGTSLHGEVISKLISRRDLAKGHIDTRRPAWKDTSDRLRMYIDLKQQAKKQDGTPDFDKKEHPFARGVVVPASYSILHVLLTQLMSIFSSREPFIQLRGRGPEDVNPGKAMEQVLAYDLEQMQIFRVIYSLCKDTLTFGTGILYDFWDTEHGEKVVRHQPPPGPIGQQMLELLGPTAFMSKEWGVVKEHNRWQPVDPFNYYPDPRVPIGEPQDGEFIGHRFFRGIMYLLERASAAGGPYFNIKELKDLGSSSDRTDDRAAAIGDFQTDKVDDQDSGVYDLDHLQIKIIPKEWGLGESNYPEIWWFTWADDNMIIRAHPNPYEHKRFTYAVAESDPDFHSAFNPGIIESIDGLQKYMDWMFNCVDDQTEVLTECGWKLAADLSKEDKVATIDPDSKDMWFEEPSELFEYDFDGELTHIVGSRMDMAVTPNHKMFVSKYGKNDYQFLEADKLQDHWQWSTAGNVNWEGSVPFDITFDETVPQRERGVDRRYKAADIDSMTFARFIGYFVSDGSILQDQENSRYAVSIRQPVDRYADDIDDVMSKMPFHVTRYEKDGYVSWTISDKRLSEYLRETCYTGLSGAETKRFPAFLKLWDKEHLSAAFTTAMNGDGHTVNSDGLAQFGSRSKQLVDDMQEIAIKLGYFANSVVDTVAERPFFRLNMAMKKTFPTIANHQCKTLPYKGKVYCFENSTHLTLWRRNGKMGIHGQSHIENLMKHLNDAMIFSPALIESGDITNPGPGRHIRLTPLGEELLMNGGYSISQFVHQLPIQDVTAPHLNAMNQMFSLAQRMSAANDPQMGMPTEDKRTLGEIQVITASASQRISTIARLIDSMAIAPISQRAIQNRLQFTEMEQYYRIVGDAAKDTDADFVFAGKFDLIGNFDYIPQSGVAQPDPVRLSRTWAQILDTLARMAPVMGPSPDGKVPDLNKVAREVFKTMGAKNIDEFFVDAPPPAPPEVMADEQVQQEVQAGNMVPMG